MQVGVCELNIISSQKRRGEFFEAATSDSQRLSRDGICPC